MHDLVHPPPLLPPPPPPRQVQDKSFCNNGHDSNSSKSATISAIVFWDGSFCGASTKVLFEVRLRFTPDQHQAASKLLITLKPNALGPKPAIQHGPEAWF